MNISKIGEIDMAVVINPTFRLDVNGKLFRNKHTNTNVQETIVFNNLMTRLSINKGDLPLFPSLGLKQYFGKFNFEDESGVDLIRAQFEEELEAQMQRQCRIHVEKSPDEKHLDVSIEVEGLEYPVQFKYSNSNGSIRVIEPQFTE